MQQKPAQTTFKKYKTPYHRSSKPSIDKIIDNLYLGDRNAATSKEILEKHNISHIIVAGIGLQIAFPDTHIYKPFPLVNSRSQNIQQFFEEAVQFIHEARKEGKTVLVHCRRGASRSATLVIAYLMVLNSWTFKEAFDFVKSIRSVVSPNPSFQRQLETLEKEIREKIFVVNLE